MASSNPLSTEELFKHVQDSPYFHLPGGLLGEGVHVYLPQPLATPVGAGHAEADHPPADHTPDDEEQAHSDGAHDASPGPAEHAHEADHGSHAHGVTYEAVFQPKTGLQVLDKSLGPVDFVFTRFMFLELVVAFLLVLTFGLLAKAISGGAAAKGRLANMLESMLLFIRDDVARPCIGKHGADEWLPFLWTMFFFVLGLNLFGMVPWMGSATGALAVTGTLALITFAMVVYAGSKEMGFVGFIKAQVPHMELPKPIAVLLVPMIFVIEIFGLLVKHFVLAVRLLANMMAGHIVLAVIVAFIAAAWKIGPLTWGTVSIASLLGAVALSLLELFVAFLQAYIFVFLSALFIGAAKHPH